jgi:hemerythrin-like domain-containing protein
LPGETLHPCLAALVTEHRETEALLTDALRSLRGQQASAAAAAPAAGHLAQALEVHIAKEEEALFPPLREALAGDQIRVDEMIAEHDAIRAKRESFEAVLNDLYGDHEELRQACADLERAGRSDLSTLRDTLSGVLMMLRAHFANEEEGIFPLAQELLSAAELDAIAAQYLVLESAARGGGPRATAS